jgi:hypothetical protein
MKYAIIIGVLLMPTLAHASEASLPTCIQNVRAKYHGQQFISIMEAMQSDIANCEYEEHVRASNVVRLALRKHGSDTPLLSDPQYNGE